MRRSVADHQATSGVGTTPSMVDVHALAGQAGGQGGLEQRARAPGVPADGEAVAAEHPGRGAPEGERQLGGQLGVGEAPDAVGAEPERRPDSPAPISAWSTGAPCGPS